MRTLTIQKMERIRELLSDPSELRREMTVRLNARRVARAYASGSDKAPFPSVVLLVVNELCNQHCRICDIGRRDENSFYYQAHFKGRGTMSKGTFEAVIKSVEGRGTELWLLATEPLLYLDLFWAIEYALSRGVDIQLTTNGYLLPETAERLVRAGLKRICVSIDGYSAELHDFIRDSAGSYDKAVNGIELLIDAKKKTGSRRPHIFINTAISQWNFDSLKSIVERFCGYDIYGITFSHLQFLTSNMAQLHTRMHGDFPITGRNVTCNDREKIDPIVLWWQISGIKEKYRRFRVNITPDLKSIDEVRRYYFEPNKYIEGYSICYMPWRYPHILPDGDVVVNYECFNKPMGNIRRQELSSIWNGDKFLSFRRFIRENKGSTPACWRCPMIYCGYKL